MPDKTVINALVDAFFRAGEDYVWPLRRVGDGINREWNLRCLPRGALVGTEAHVGSANSRLEGGVGGEIERGGGSGGVDIAQAVSGDSGGVVGAGAAEGFDVIKCGGLGEEKSRREEEQVAEHVL